MAWTTHIDTSAAAPSTNGAASASDSVSVAILLRLAAIGEETNKQLKLLNARIEEAFETDIEEGDQP